MEAQQHRTNRSRFASDGGVSLIELVVAMGFVALLIGVVMHNFTSSNAVTRNQVSRTELWSTMQDASGQLLRDVADGTKIETATAQKLVLYTVRDELCERRTYAVDATAGTMSVTTDWFAQESCAGPIESKTDILVRDYTGTATFTYFNALDKQIPAPVQDVRNVTRVGWALKSHPTGATNDVTLNSGSVFRGKSDASGSGKDSVSAQAPILSVTTSTSGPTTHEGVSKPVLSWVDASPSITTGWTVYRVSNPEGATTGTRTWTPVATLPNPAANTYTDASLLAGYNGIYVVQAAIADPNGQAAPMSNQAVTGLRPAPIANLTAVAAAQSITLTWTAPTGQVGADVYRDGILVDRVTGATATFTDGPGKRGWVGAGWGHSHTFAVVPSNRWELYAFSGSQSLPVPLDEPIGKVYLPGVTGGSTRAGSNVAGAFTAPAAPTASSASTTAWTYTLNWTAAPWTGAGPTTLGGVARDRGWLAYRNASVTATASGAWNALWGGVENGPGVASKATASYGTADGGNYGHFQLKTCNAVGCSPATTTNDSIMRPKAPLSCTASGTTSRATTVTVNPAGTQAPNSGSSLSGGSSPAGFSVTGTGSSGGFVYNVDQLLHATAHTFTAAVTNAGGTSDAVTCAASTLTVAVSTPTWSSTTRSIDASATSTNASDSNITLETVSTVAGLTGAWDPLVDGTAFTLTARAGDGVNNVAAQAAAATQVLATPGKPATPVCTYSATDTVKPGGYTIAAVTRGIYSTGPGRTASGLGVGSYNGWAYTTGATNSDGYNSHTGPDSAKDSCPTMTVTLPPLTVGCPSAGNVNQSALGLIYMNMIWCGTEGADSYEFQTQVYDPYGAPSGWGGAISVFSGGDTAGAAHSKNIDQVSNSTTSGGEIRMRVIRGAEVSPWWTSPKMTW